MNQSPFDSMVISLSAALDARFVRNHPDTLAILAEINCNRETPAGGAKRLCEKAQKWKMPALPPVSVWDL